MARLQWDRAEHPFEAGVDRGVLYLESGKGVAWSGLISVVDQAEGGEQEAHYYDGEKYLDVVGNEDTLLGIEAFTYPDEFSDYDGYQDILDKQGRKLFGFSYRTQTRDSYKIHLVYNCTAIPGEKTWETESDNTDPTTFSWTVPAVPVPVPGAKPTAHLVIDASEASATVIDQIEAILYGVTKSYVIPVVDGGTTTVSSTDEIEGGDPYGRTPDILDGGQVVDELDASSDARMPTAAEMVELFVRNATFIVIDHGDGSWTATGDSDIVYMTDETSFEINWPLAIFSATDTYSIRSS